VHEEHENKFELELEVTVSIVMPNNLKLQLPSATATLIISTKTSRRIDGKIESFLLLICAPGAQKQATPSIIIPNDLEI
jgi:hypothetical protein